MVVVSGRRGKGSGLLVAGSKTAVVLEARKFVAIAVVLVSGMYQER